MGNGVFNGGYGSAINYGEGDGKEFGSMEIS